MAFDPNKSDQVARLINDTVAMANQIIQDQDRLNNFINTCLVNNVPAILSNPATVFPAQFTVDRQTLANARTAVEACQIATANALAIQKVNLDNLRLMLGVLVGTD